MGMVQRAVLEAAPRLFLLSMLSLLGCASSPLSADGGVRMDADDGASMTDGAGEDAPLAADGALDDAPLAPDAPDEADAGLTETRRVLFIGNSYTYYNDLPAVVVALGAASGVLVEAEVIAPAGATFCEHFDNIETRARIASTEHDAVVFQGQSVDMFYGGKDAYYCAQSLGLAARDAAARITWFATWARREGDEFYSRGRGVTTPAEMTDFVEGWYRNVARWSGAGGHVARVGRAWERTLAMLPGVILHADDGSHPTAAGTLVAACAVTQSLLGRVPEMPSPPPLGLDADLAAMLCDLGTTEPCFDALEFCGGECLSVAFNATHCGACDAACPSPRECWLSTCGCGPSFDLGTTFEDLRALDPACDGSAARPAATCGVAAHLSCVDLPCGGTGVGPITTETGEVQVLCAPGTVVTTTYAELATHQPACDGVAERHGDACRTAAHRACIAGGAAAGLGPVSDTGGDDVEIACVDAYVRFVPDLAIDSWGCTGYPTRAWDATCDRVVDTMCTRMGYYGGYGPIESSSGRTDGVDIVCLTR